MNTTDVIIVGAGPTGLMLACELRLAGVRPVVLEQLPSPTGQSKALGTGGRAVDVLDYRGLLERFQIDRGTEVLAKAAHFGGIPLDLARLGSTRFLPVPQSRIEEILEQRARELGAVVRRGCAVVDLRQDHEGVTLEVRGPAGAETLRARFVVGCDGAHSAVRRLAGIGFPGLAPTRLFRMGHVTLAPGAVEPGQLVLPGGRRVRFGVGGVTIAPIGGGIYRVVVGAPYPPDFDRDLPMTLGELQAALAQTLGEELPIVEAKWVTRFTDASRLAERYREARVLLAGDAAHIHLPAGGPGILTGMLDAVNLGWKLAAEVNGWAPHGLLDTYHTERHSEGQRVLNQTRAQGALLRPDDEQVRALRELVTQLIQYDQVFQHIIGLQQQLDTVYPMDREPGEPHPLLGRWAPDLPLRTPTGRTRVAELMRDARGVLLDLEGDPALTDVARDWADRVETVTAHCERRPTRAMLIRPDGFVAWAAADDASLTQSQSRLRDALSHWFGEPSPTH
jgi:2-polyprenyl-6-methoxyphenol hydroxylase-like FAD-dependent oxidoreductase